MTNMTSPIEEKDVILDKKEMKRKQKKEQKLKAIQRREERLSKRLPNSFPGRHKWLGGSVDMNTGIIYGVPSHAVSIICIHPPNNKNNHDQQPLLSTIPLPIPYREGHFKWLRGIITNGYLYGIPAWCTHGVLKARVLTTTSIQETRSDHDPPLNHTNEKKQKEKKKKKGPQVQILPLPHTPEHYRKNIPQTQSRVDRGRWMWHGGAYSKLSNAIYCIPSNAERVLKVDVETDQVTEIGPSFPNGQNKWYGGIIGKDGCIYGMPYTATGVLRINPRTDTVQVLGNYPFGGWKWHGGLMAPSNGVIYAFPAHAKDVLCVDTNPANNNNNNNDNSEDEDDDTWRVRTIPIEKGPHDDDPDDLRYKWLGGSHGADGCVYGMPSDATSILKIDPFEQKATTFGKVSDIKNKWQGGVLCPLDQCVYAVPADMNNILKIHTGQNNNNNNYNKIDFVDIPPSDVEDKWQGGFLAADGSIYGIPENIDRVMKLTPGDDAYVQYL